jgi:hypothetical protein
LLLVLHEWPHRAHVFEGRVCYVEIEPSLRQRTGSIRCEDSNGVFWQEEQQLLTALHDEAAKVRHQPHHLSL